MMKLIFVFCIWLLFFNSASSQSAPFNHSVFIGYRVLPTIIYINRYCPPNFHGHAFGVGYRANYAITRRVEVTLEPTFVHTRTGYIFSSIEAPLVLTLANNKPYERQFFLSLALGGTLHLKGTTNYDYGTRRNDFTLRNSAGSNLMLFTFVGVGKRYPVNNRILSLDARFRTSHASAHPNSILGGCAFMIGRHPNILPRVMLNIGITLNKIKSSE